MELPLNQEEARILRGVIDEYLAALEEEMVKSPAEERNAARHRVETIVRTIGARLEP